MKQDTQNGRKHVSVDVDQMQRFVIISIDKCKCECKELIDKGVCDKGFIQNRSNCENGYDKSCDVGEFLDYEDCKCRKRSVDKLVQECTENIEKAKISCMVLFEHRSECLCSYTILLSWL